MSTEPTYNPYAPGQQVQELSPADQRLWSTLMHLGGIVFGFWPALIGYLVLKDRGPFVLEHAKTSLNFQISIVLYSIIVGFFTLITFGFGALLYFPLAVIAVIFMIVAGMAANRGELYVYPLTIAFIK
jgi:uncharacterized protein